MTTGFAITAVAFAAFCVWLTVRIVNRRERWAKWTLAVTLCLPVLYVVSFGPACWWFAKPQPSSLTGPFMIGLPYAFPPRIYAPLHRLAFYGPEPVQRFLFWYAKVGRATERQYPLALPTAWESWDET